MVKPGRRQLRLGSYDRITRAVSRIRGGHKCRTYFMYEVRGEVGSLWVKCSHVE